jgi:hypothetical protein
MHRLCMLRLRCSQQVIWAEIEVCQCELIIYKVCSQCCNLHCFTSLVYYLWRTHPAAANVDKRCIYAEQKAKSSPATSYLVMPAIGVLLPVIHRSMQHVSCVQSTMNNSGTASSRSTVLPARQSWPL